MSKSSQRQRRATTRVAQKPASGGSRFSARLLLWLGLLLVVGAGLILYRFVGVGEDGQLQAARVAMERRDFSAATEHLEDYLLEHPDDTGARLLAAQAARRGGNYPSAQRHLKQCIADGSLPEMCELESHLLAMAQGDTSKVEFLLGFCTSHSSAPETPLILEGLIVADLLRLSDPLDIPRPYPIDDIPPELDRLQKSISLWLDRPLSMADEVQGLIWRGRTRVMAREHAEALADFQRAMELDNRHFEARLYLALSTAAEQPRQALAQLDELGRLYPDDQRLPFVVAPLLRSTGELDRAEKLLDQLLRTHPDMPLLLIERGNLALDLKQPAEAKRYLDAAAQIDPDTARLHLALARYMVMVGDADAAREHQERFLLLESERSHPQTRQFQR